MKFYNAFAAAVVIAGMASCKSYMTVPYFQDVKDPMNMPVIKAQQSTLTVRPADRLNIVVSSSLTPEMSVCYNLPLQSNRIGAASGVASSSSYSTMPYIVDTNGNIDFPGVGKIRVAGMTREQIEDTVQDILIKNQLLNDAVVTCEVLNHYVNVLGDVRSPGRVQIEKDNITIIDALAKCGDMNVTAERQTVTVIRNVDGKQRVYNLDFTSAQDVYNSEAYYLLPEDVVYVNPNVTKQRTSMAVGNSWQTPSVYFSLTSIMLSVTTLIVSLTKK